MGRFGLGWGLLLASLVKEIKRLRRERDMLDCCCIFVELDECADCHDSNESVS